MRPTHRVIRGPDGNFCVGFTGPPDWASIFREMEALAAADIVSTAATAAPADPMSALREAERCIHRDCVGCGCRGCRCELARKLVTIRDCLACVTGREL